MGVSVCIVITAQAYREQDMVATAFIELGHLWSNNGHHVTLLLVPASQTSAPEHIKSAGTNADLTKLRIVTCPIDPEYQYLGHFPASHMASLWLQQKNFDTIYFADRDALARVPLLTKRCGLGFGKTKIVVGVHGPSSWHQGSSTFYTGSYDSLLMDAAERQCLALADCVITASHYMLDYLRSEDWKLSDDVRILPPPLRPPRQAVDKIEPQESIDEIVFHGRLERWAGIDRFLQALNFLPDAVAQRLSVTFLIAPGASPDNRVQMFVPSENNRFRAWKIVENEDECDALKYLARPGRLAVMPALHEDFPRTIRLYLAHHIPFLASNVGGIPELITPRQHKDFLIAPIPSALAAMIEKRVTVGPVYAEPVQDTDEIKERWLSLLSEKPQPIERDSRDVKVSVVMTTFNRVAELNQALDGLRAQTWKGFELILVDDGSFDPEAIANLKRLQPEFDQKGWRIIHQANAYVGAARNRGWRAAKGDIIIFHDDDNYAAPTFIETHVRALQTSGADIATSGLSIFEGPLPDGDPDNGAMRWLPMGDAAGPGLYANNFGDTAASWRRQALEKTGGFMETYGAGHDDWNAFARAVLKGCNLITIPKSLYWYRRHENAMSQTKHICDSHMVTIQPYLPMVPGPMRAALKLAIFQYLNGESPEEDVRKKKWMHRYHRLLSFPARRSRRLTRRS